MREGLQLWIHYNRSILQAWERSSFPLICFDLPRTEYLARLAEIVKETVPNCRIEYAADAGPDKRCYRVDCSKIANTLPNFQPQWDARKGAAELYEAYKQVGLTLEEFEGSKYQRIAHIKYLLGNGLLDKDLRWQSAKLEVIS